MATSRPEDRRTRPRFTLTPAVFRYTGRTQSTVAGPVSGRYYRFGATGATAEVDPRDAPWLGHLPDLERLE
jgi:hypothetical protein